MEDLIEDNLLEEDKIIGKGKMVTIDPRIDPPSKSRKINTLGMIHSTIHMMDAFGKILINIEAEEYKEV